MASLILRCGFHLAVSLCVLCAWVAPSLAQEYPPPTLTVTPNPPPANQPFSAVYTVHTFANAFGFGTLGGPPNPIEVTGNTILVPFSHGCGFICQPIVPRSFPFEMPALAAGTYTVLFNPSTPLAAEFELIVGGVATPPSPVPGPGRLALFLLVAALGLIGGLHLRRRSCLPTHPPGRP